MRIVLVSSPEVFPDEHEIANTLFEKGLEYFHLRKPGFSLEAMEVYLKKIKPAFIKRMVIHSHYKLIEKFNLGGIHLPENIRNEEIAKEIIPIAKRKRLSVSTSVHKLEDLAKTTVFDYVFLGPVFNSISKPGYHSTIMPEDFSKYKSEKEVKPKVIALGGVSRQNIGQLVKSRFDGAALLGCIWKQGITATEALEEFLNCKEKLIDGLELSS